jgi:hypothetical protein
VSWRQFKDLKDALFRQPCAILLILNMFGQNHFKLTFICCETKYLYEGLTKWHDTKWQMDQMTLRLFLDKLKMAKTAYLPK